MKAVQPDSDPRGTLPRKKYTRVLSQLLLLPLIALGLLAGVLGYSLERLEASAAKVDHADQIIAQANRLLLLMVDEETGVRGYFLTHDPAFLQPYRRAQLLLPQVFNSTLRMLGDDPGQKVRMEDLRKNYQDWQALTQQELSQPAAAIDMRARKGEMDALRVEAKDFLGRAQMARHRQSLTATRAGSLVSLILLGIILVVAIAIALLTFRSFRKLEVMFASHLEEAERQRSLASEGEQWLNTTLRSIGDGVIACDQKGAVTLMNPVAEELTGWREQEARGRPLPEIFQIVNEQTRILAENPVEKVLRTSGVVGLANHTLLIRRDGSECGIEDSAAPIRSASGGLAGIVLVFRDSTERRNSQKALMRAEKLAAAGKLAASIAHEVNNPLEGLTNVLYLAAESTELGEAKHWLEQAQAEVNRLSHITRRTLGFYRESAQPTVYRPAEVAEEVLSFYVPEALSKNVRLEAQIRTQQETFGIPGELRQVLSNLLTNSLDAMPDGGVIRLVVRDSTDLKDSTQAGVRIVVADTGSGIRPDILRRVFEPFFTTKLDTGTGLGLWVSKELIEKQGGTLRVRSRTTGPVTGTIFSIYVPLHAAGEIA